MKLRGDRAALRPEVRTQSLVDSVGTLCLKYGKVVTPFVTRESPRESLEENLKAFGGGFTPLRKASAVSGTLELRESD